MADAPQVLRILLVEDDKRDVVLLKRMLDMFKEATFQTVNAETLADGLEMSGKHCPDVVLLDLNLPDSLGVETLQEIRKRCADLPIIVVTGLDDRDSALGALQAGARDYLVKGKFDSQLLGRAVLRALVRRPVEARNAGDS